MSRLLLHETILFSSNVNGTSRDSGHMLPGLSFGESNGAPGLSFPLGTGLVVLIILFVSAIFSFCYHWVSLRKNIASSILTSNTIGTSSEATLPSSQALVDHSKPPPSSTKLSMVQCPPVVYMAGEEMPRYIALPCPFLKPSAEEESNIDAEKKVLEDVTLIYDLKLNIRP
eukprot:c1899_g1_i1 orf=74-586(+)